MTVGREQPKSCEGTGEVRVKTLFSLVDTGLLVYWLVSPSRTGFSLVHCLKKSIRDGDEMSPSRISGLVGQGYQSASESGVSISYCVMGTCQLV